MLPLGHGIKKPLLTWVSKLPHSWGLKVVGFPLSWLTWQKEAAMIWLSIEDV